MHTSIKHLILSHNKKIEKLGKSREIRVIGRLENILLPALSKFTLDAKIDIDVSKIDLYK